MTISHFVTPPGGWRYKEGDHWIYGDSFDDLSFTLKSHRSSNGINSDNIEKDIEDQLLSLNPSLKVDIIKLKIHGR